MIYEHVLCDLCGCDKYKVRYRKPDNWLWLNQFEFPVVECINCGLVFINPRPTEESMSLYYPQDYHDNRDTEEHFKRYKIQAEFLPVLSDEKILDVGCAKGDWLLYLKEKYPNIKTYGVDFYSKKVKSKDIIFFNKKLSECNFSNDEFDIITSWAVFEHLHAPGEYFAEVSRILKRGGRFIFLVTNSESLYGKKAYIEDIPRHTYHFSEKVLSKYAEKYSMFMSNCVYDDRLFDGRGVGTFNYKLLFSTGVSWENIYYNRFNRLQKYAGKLGSKLDKIIFRNHWEAQKRKSGIIIVEFIK